MRLLMVSVLSVLVASGGLYACASGEGGGGGAGSVIEEEELQEASGSNAYDIVQSLRPSWLRARRGRDAFPQADDNPDQPDGGGGPVVYVDGSEFGDVETLRQIGRDDLEEMEYLSPSDAQTRFGLDHDGGAILVTLRR